MRKIFITFDKTIAGLINNENKFISVEGTDGTNACLNIMKSFLQEVPNDRDTLLEESIVMYVPGVVIAIGTESINDYIRNGKTNKDNEISEENMELFKEVFNLYRDKMLNVKIRRHEALEKFPDVDVSKMRTACFKKIKDLSTEKAIEKAVAVQQPVDKHAKTRAMLEKAMEKALDNGDIDAVERYVNMIASLEGKSEPAVNTSKPATVVVEPTDEVEEIEEIEDEMDMME